jgi:hypothetical protein
VGWGIALSIWFPFLGSGFVGGLGVGIGLRRLLPAFKFPQIALTAVVWEVCRWSVTDITERVWVGMRLDNFTNALLAMAAVGLVSGLLTAACVMSVLPTFTLRGVLISAIGWAMGLGVAFIGCSSALWNVWRVGNWSYTLLMCALSGALGGAVGAAVMFRLVERSIRDARPDLPEGIQWVDDEAALKRKRKPRPGLRRSLRGFSPVALGLVLSLVVGLFLYLVLGPPRVSEFVVVVTPFGPPSTTAPLRPYRMLETVGDITAGTIVYIRDQWMDNGYQVYEVRTANPPLKEVIVYDWQLALVPPGIRSTLPQPGTRSWMPPPTRNLISPEPPTPLPSRPPT